MVFIFPQMLSVHFFLGLIFIQILPVFTGYPIEDYEIINNNILKFRMPPVYLGTCKIDFIFANEAGYALASRSSRFSYVQMV